MEEGSLEQELDAISKEYVWCSKYRTLNDPMEGYYRASPYIKRQPNYKELKAHITKRTNSTGICCFSETHENDLMWAHYAENYRGICIAYSTNNLISTPRKNVYIARVSYISDPPRIAKNTTIDPEVAVRAILSHKKTPWLYEREWRLLVSSDSLETGPPGALSLKGQSVVQAVFLGARIDLKVQRRIVEKLSGTDIEIRKMKISSYSHSWIPLKKNSNKNKTPKSI